MPITKRHFAVFLSAGILASSLAGAACASTPEALSSGFFRVVFGLEYDSDHADADRVKKYVDPVRFHVTNLSTDDRRAAVGRFLQELPARIGHLRASVVEHEEDANFRVLLVDRRNFGAVVASQMRADAVAMSARCLVGVRTRNGRIVASTAIIVADDDYLFRRCLVEEVLQGLGPMNDDDRLSESVFNDTSKHAVFTPFDQALLNMLYHPTIRPGMTRSEVQQVLPYVMRELGYR
jgi:hypothetical protein